MASKSSEPSQDVPIFLRKTYHMIDTCDPSIACWSEDGETFVVKDPLKFEQTIIPQFFKHSKFSSFVRQLNFYSFRKIKYADTIRIDPKLEKETANYWRFRHEKFRRGHPELLCEIKRMNGQKAVPTVSKQTVGAADKVEVVDKSTKSEVQMLKKRIEEMNQSIDQLTAMVQRVTLRQEERERIALAQDEVPVGSKRVKLDPTDEFIRPDEMYSTMDLEDSDIIPPLPISMPLPAPLDKRETSVMTNVTDTEFVDELFNAFTGEHDDDFDLDDIVEPSVVETALPPIAIATSSSTGTQTAPEAPDSNRPDPALLDRLSDALMLLPKDLQALIVDRLIAAILSTDLLNTSVIAKVTDDVDPKKVAAGGKAVITPEPPQSEDEHHQAAPFIAATLAALMHHYGSKVKGKNPKNIQKSIPIIPVHA